MLHIKTFFVAVVGISIAACFAQNPAAPKPAELRDDEVISLDLASDEKHIQILDTAPTVEQLKKKTNPTVVVPMSDVDETFFFWRSNAGQWTIAEVFKYQADGKNHFAIGAAVKDYSYQDGRTYPVFKTVLPKLEVKELIAEPRNKDIVDGSGTLPFGSSIEFARLTMKFPGSGGLTVQVIFLFHRKAKGQWCYAGEVHAESVRNGWSVYSSGKAELHYDCKANRFHGRFEHTDNWAIDNGGEGATRLPIKTYSSKTFFPGESKCIYSEPYLLISDLEPYKDKYMGGKITLDSFAGFRAFCEEPFKETRRQKEKTEILEKLKIANPNGIEQGVIFLVRYPLTKESAERVEKYQKILLALGFKGGASYTYRYTKQNVKMSEVRQIVAKLFDINPPADPFLYLDLPPCSPVFNHETPDYLVRDNNSLCFFMRTYKRDIKKDDTLVDVSVRIQTTKVQPE